MTQERSSTTVHVHHNGQAVFDAEVRLDNLDRHYIPLGLIFDGVRVIVFTSDPDMLARLARVAMRASLELAARQAEDALRPEPTVTDSDVDAALAAEIPA